MLTCNLELIAAGRPFLIGLGCSSFMAGLGYFLARNRTEWQQKRPMLILGLLGIVILLTGAITLFVPTLVAVPTVDGLSREAAENRLRSRSLSPSSTPRYATGVQAGRVIPGSQSPVAGLEVRCGTTVSFAVAVSGARIPEPSNVGGSVATMPMVEIFEPRSGARATITRGPDGVGRMSVNGVSQGVQDGRFHLLLWMRPVMPPSDVPGWYLQWPPSNGITEISTDGSWRGVAQIGNPMWPPQEGHVVDLAVTVADSATASRLLSEGGVVVSPEPVGVTSSRVSGVVLSFR